MKKIQMVDLRTQYLRIKPEIDQCIQSVLDSTAFIQGPSVGAFAQALKEYTGAREVVTCANGTDALQIAMMALDLAPGDEIVLPVHTYVATAEVIALLKLTPVFVDVDENTFNLDVGQLKNVITTRTKVIVPVHLYGQCADMERILKIAKDHGLFVIEDAAQALGATYTFSDGTTKQAGTMGTIGTTSFFPSKNLGCFGDGGAIFTEDSELAEKIRMIANHGQRTKYHHDCIGVNSRLDTLQAAILSVKLKYLTDYTYRRNEAADRYDKFLSSISQITIPARARYSTHVFHQYTLKAKQRDKLKAFLETKGIPTMIYYPLPLHLQKAYARPEFPIGTFPITESLSTLVISLPIHTEMEELEQEFICTSIGEFYHMND
jgi:UDP-2-acetamido-2-deoxy-ribo-hexuluronate aminotransferase